MSTYTERSLPLKRITLRHNDNSSTSIDNLETEMLPVVAQRTEPLNLHIPLYHEHRSSSSPLELLYGAILAFRWQHRSLPDCLFISSQTEEKLQQQHLIAYRAPYVGHFNFALSHKEVDSIPVFNESFLPDLFRMALGSKLQNDYVLALAEN